MNYAPLGSPEFQAFFGEQMREVGERTEKALGDNLASLWLGGGFGRGEGAITRASGREQAYNDVDLFLYVRDANAVDESAIREIEHEFTQRLGAHLEFSRPLEIKTVPHIRPALMWFDVLKGHEVMAGHVDVAAMFAPEISRVVPVHEGPRLMLNRGAGLVWALRVVRGYESAPDPDFVRRNVWKARLALVEASLIVSQRYVFGLNAKQEAFTRLATEKGFSTPLLRPTEVERACRFKLDPDREPDRPDEVETDALCWEIAFREIEGMRFGRTFASTESYSMFTESREPSEGVGGMARNFLRNAKAGRIGIGQPREDLYRRLPALLASSGSTWDEKSASFLEDWRRFC